MSRIHGWTLIAACSALPGLAAAQQFEGRVDAKMGGNPNRPPADVVIYSRGGKTRMESNMGGMSMAMLFDYQGGSMTTLMAAQKMYMKMDLRQAAARIRGMTGQTDSTAANITRTGKHETIAGIDCEHIVFAGESGRQTDVCAAKGMGFFAGGGSPGRGGRASGVPADMDRLMREFRDGFFPLKIEGIEGTTRTQVMLVTKVERQTLDPAMFEVPADYTEMQMPPGMPGRP